MNESVIKRPAKSVYILPNLFTTAGLFAGFYAIMQSRLGHFEAACLGIYVAMVMDIVDGRLARLTGTMTEFGSEYDSLSDMVSFGVAPSLVMYEFALNGLGRFGSLLAFIYVACAAIRLARFNVVASDDKSFFTGLPSPGAAALIASCVWVCVDYNVEPAKIIYLLAALILAAALAMVSNVPYRSFKDFDFKDKMPFVGAVIVVFIIAIIYLDPPSAFLIIGGTYLLSGVIVHVLKHRKDPEVENININEQQD